MSSALLKLQEWYISHCDGDWEHGFGISVGTLDNPGWSLSINLEETELENVPFAELKENYDDERDWLICAVHNNQFSGSSGPLKLERMIEVFLEWAQAVTIEPPNQEKGTNQ